jgi:hypothetical protein
MTQEQKPTVEELEEALRWIKTEPNAPKHYTKHGNVIIRKRIEHILTQALEIAKGDKVVVRKSDIAKAMLTLLTSESIDDTIWLDEKDMIGMTLFEHLEIIGDINIENRCPAEMADQLEAMIAVAEGEK